MYLTKKIQEKFSKIKDIENLNRGGCLFAAYGVYLSLKKDGLDCSNLRIVQLASCDDIKELNKNKSFLKGDSQNAESSSHFAITVNGKDFYDSTGVITKDYLYHLEIPSNQIDSFSKSSLKNGQWNSSFERNEGVPLIENNLGIKFN